MSSPTAEANPPLRCELLPDLSSAREDWDRLALSGDNVFATWEWASAWWRHHGEGRPLCLVGCRNQEGELVGILPVYLASRRPLRVVRLLGHGAGDELGPICAPRNRAAVVAAARTGLDLLEPGWDVFVAESLPGDAAWRAFEGGRQLSRIPNPVLEIGGISWDDYMASRSGKFRQQVRRNERRLSRDHSLAYRMTDDPAQLEADLDTLVELHGARWGKESSGVFAGADARLHREFAAAALERGWLRLWFLELEGSPVAARLGYRFGGADVGYQSGRDPAWDRFGVGFLLQVHTIREAMTDGIGEYRFLRGGEGYKDRFANADRGLETIVVPRGLRGRAALAARRASLAIASRRKSEPWAGRDGA
jgi:CelD/BcsL family acetyltransferase involved in cellulose biosynthesis